MHMKSFVSVIIAAVALSVSSFAFGQVQGPPSTVAGWNQLLDQTDINNPRDPMQMLTAMTVRAYQAAYPSLPDALKQKVRAGRDLTNAEVNLIADTMAKKLADLMAAQMGGEAMEPEKANIPAGSEDETSLKAFVRAMEPRMGGAAAAPVARPAVPPDAEQDWKDFIHYARIANLKLAAAHGRQFLAANLDPAAMLEVVENSVYGDAYEKDLQRMMNMTGEGVEDSGIAEVATAVSRAIDEAKLKVIRNPSRIRIEIAKLDDSLRARSNATRRLVEAGEYAAPQMLEIISGVGENAEALRPYVIEAAVTVGRPLVVPFSEAIDVMPPVAQQDVARILARIGYPASLPYLKQLIELGKLDTATADVVQNAFEQIAKARHIAPDAPAADLYLGLGEDYYAYRSSLIMDPTADYNLRWMVDSRGQLIYQRIPTPVYGDVMSMQAARRALQLNNDLADALSLWLAANFRRENNLPDGATDPSYGGEMRSPAYYAMTAGPGHIKPVLARAVVDHDPELALDAIRALAATAGTESLTHEAGAVLRALNYPDARVRYETAFAVTRANPAEPFEGSGRVIPVLAEAVRQTGRRIALVIAPDQDERNALTAKVREAGYDVLAGAEMEDVEGELMNVPTADLVVIQSGLAYLNAFTVTRGNSYKLSAAPMVVLGLPGEVVQATRMFADDPAVAVIDGGAANPNVGEAIKQAAAAMAGPDLSATQDEAYAVQSLDLLRDLALKRSPVFDVSLAKDSLIAALGDEREAVMLGAAGVLAMIDAPEAQQALADTALSERAGTAIRVEVFGDLADSAKRSGNLLTERQLGQMNELIGSARGELADAAAQAYGALNLPTARSVTQITD